MEKSWCVLSDVRPPAYPALAAAIAARGLTQPEVGAAVGIATGSVSAVLRGELRPSVSLRARFAALFDIDEDTLFELHPDIARLVESAVAQGLGRVVEDPNVLRRVAALTRTRGDHAPQPA